MRVRVTSGWTREPVRNIIDPPFANTLPNDEADVRVKDGAEKSGLDLLSAKIRSTSASTHLVDRCSHEGSGVV